MFSVVVDKEQLVADVQLCLEQMCCSGQFYVTLPASLDWGWKNVKHVSK